MFKGIDIIAAFKLKRETEISFWRSPHGFPRRKSRLECSLVSSEGLASQPRTTKAYPIFFFFLKHFFEPFGIAPV
jgi:hypothetical protein